MDSFSHLTSLFLNYLTFEKRYSSHTVISYRNDLNDFTEYINTQYGSLTVNEIQHIHVRSWMAALKEKGITARSIHRKISCLKSFYKFCLKNNYAESSPLNKIISPKVDLKIPEFLKENEVQLMLNSLEDLSGSWKEANAKLLIAVFYATGMRLSELIQLKEKQVDFRACQIKVLGKGKKERIIPVSKNLMQHIEHYIMEKNKKFENPQDTLIVTEKGKPLYPKYVWNIINQYLSAFSTLNKKSPHILRHTFATHLMNRGAGLNAVKELLGHSSLAATQVYTHNTIEKLKEIHQKHHPKP
ncbi:MAG: tyrosine-type recombinase/integrase [Chitinophagaceae bacterium]|nr:tyrosine-type recombinase/integrase [Chitinophagaceae bacterium]